METHFSEQFSQAKDTDIALLKTINQKQSEEIQSLLACTHRLEHGLVVANENVVSMLRTLGAVSDNSVPFDRVVLPHTKIDHEHMLENIAMPEEEQSTTTQPIVTAASLMFLKMQELKEICRQHGLKGWSHMKKVELVEFIVKRV
jgi:hypothetical protein